MSFLGNLLKTVGTFAQSLFGIVPAPVDTAAPGTDGSATSDPAADGAAPAAVPVPDEELVIAEHVEDAITIVTNIKNTLSSPVVAFVTNLIPGGIAADIREELIDGLPGIIAGLTFADGVLKTSDKSAQLNMLLANIKFSDKPSLDALWHTLAARVLMIRSGGTVSWSNAVIAVEYYLTHLLFQPAPQLAVAGPIAQAAAPVIAAATAIADDVEGKAAPVTQPISN